MHYFPFDSSSAILLISLGHLQGNHGNSLTLGTPIVAASPAIPGAVWLEEGYIDETGDYLYLAGEQGSFTWEHDWPLGAIPLEWSLVAAPDGNPYQNMVVNFILEVVKQI